MQNRTYNNCFSCIVTVSNNCKQRFLPDTICTVLLLPIISVGFTCTSVVSEPKPERETLPPSKFFKILIEYSLIKKWPLSVQIFSSAPSHSVSA